LDHLLLSCVHSPEIWFRVLQFFGMADLAPSWDEPVAVWWLRARKAVAKPCCKGFDAPIGGHPRWGYFGGHTPWARAGFVSIAALLGFRRRAVAP
jgi:hypothetical protein